MEDNQFKVLNDKLDSFIKETRDQASIVFDDKEMLAKKIEDIYLQLGKLTNEFYLFKDEIQKHTKTVKQETKETQEAIAEGVEAIEENLLGKTKIVVKEVDIKKKHWYKLFRR